MPLPKYKNCQKGYACGRSCINRSKNCRKRLAGQARNNAEWLKINSTGSSSPQDYILRGRRLLSDEDAAFINNYAAESDRIESGLSKHKNRPQDDEYVKFLREKFALEERLKDIRSKILDTSPLSVEEATELVERQVTFSKGEKSTVKKHLIDFARMSGGLGLDKKLSVKEVQRRASASEMLGLITVSSNDKLATFHEAAHHIEYQNPHLGRAANSWKYSRAFSRNAKTLRSITGDRRYQASEFALEGNFIHPYVGKIYESASHTEVISIGMEKLSSPKEMAELARDPDHFFFTLGVLRR